MCCKIISISLPSKPTSLLCCHIAYYYSNITVYFCNELLHVCFLLENNEYAFIITHIQREIVRYRCLQDNSVLSYKMWTLKLITVLWTSFSRLEGIAEAFASRVFDHVTYNHTDLTKF